MVLIPICVAPRKMPGPWHPSRTTFGINAHTKHHSSFLPTEIHDVLTKTHYIRLFLENDYVTG